MEINPNLRISTMTLISNLNSDINLDNLYDSIEINDIFRYIEHGPLKRKGKKEKEKINKKCFYNQITIHIFEDKIINMKIFNNGKIQMTGAKSKLQGSNALNVLIRRIKSLDENIKSKIMTNVDFEPSNIEIGMINSDFDCGFKIKRENLHRIVIEKGYYSSFEPTIYPGVNIKYYYNPLKQTDGICNCTEKCNGKGENGCCKKITIAVFNSGKIIITGGKSYTQYNKSYDFINDILENNKDELFLKNEKV